MLKVFLVEDEFVVREGIKNNIDWNSYGYEFVGDASDGERAFPLIEKTQPDIVITDIKMPFMDGLELSRLIKNKMPWIEIIVLSGYSEFEYAREAIKLGVAEFISKPVNGEELIHEVNILAEKIEKKHQEREINEKYRREMEENTNAHKKRLFNYLVTGSKTLSELLEKAEKINLNLTAAWYNIVLLGLRANESGQSLSIEEGEALYGSIAEKLEDNEVTVFDRNLEGIALLVKGDTEAALLKIQNSKIAEIKSILSSKTTGYFGGIGQPVERISELPKSFDKAAHAFAHRYFMQDNSFLDFSQVEKPTKENEEEFDIFNIDTRQIDRSKIQSFLKTGEMSETGFFVDEFVRGIGQQAFESNLFRQYIVMDVYFCIVEFVENYGFSKNEIPVPDMNMFLSGSTESTRNYLENILSSAVELRTSEANNRYRLVVEEAKNYIHENYADENLSLNELAKYVCFSPNHLSTIFAQETGQTFIKYLTEYRINKSMDLLKCTGHRSSEISCMVGYKDPHYFSFFFKKIVGVTPTQYRDGKTE